MSTASQARFRLLIATRNSGKVSEVRSLLRELPIDLFALTDLAGIESIAETGSSYRENAILKSIGYGRQTGLISIADDSGLEIDALDGAPGVFSARYGGPGLSDTDRIRLVLDELSKRDPATRSARFRSVVAVADGHGNLLNISEGKCQGEIIMEPRGTSGFGYDPIFVPQGYTQTFGELPESVKDGISHRAVAMKATRRFLREWLERLDASCSGS
jgi:XTP/dITP diphosphohydrolase